MAKGDGTTLEKLYLELGLDLSALQSDILAADKTVTENLGRLNRERNLIKIRMQADVSGLDAAKDATQILALQEKSLNEQLTISKDRLAILEAAYKQVASNQNSTALAIQNAEKQWQRERIEVGKLEAALKALASQKISFNTSQVQSEIDRLNAKIKNIKITAEIDTSKLREAGNVFDEQKTHVAALTKEIELQRQKYAQLQTQMTEASKAFGGDSSITLNIKTNVLQQEQEIQRLEQKLKELQSTDINLKIRADSIKQAEQTINENIANINAKIDLIRVKTEVDTSKLGAAVSEFDKAKTQVTALNRELTLQNQKLAEMQKLLSTANGTKAINLAADVQRQIQAIDQLKAKIQELNNIQPPKSGLLSDYLGIKGDISGQLNNIATSFQQLKDATSSADNAIVSVLGVIDAIPLPVGKAITALAGLPIVFAGIENSIVDMMKSTAAAGDSAYVMSRGFQMSVADTGKFTTMCKTAGVEVNDLASTLKRLQQSIVRGGDEAKAEQWLKRYGESAYDASGKLKDLNEMTLSLSRALKKAQADGKGMEFILATMRNASADTITAIEDAEGVYEQASHIVKAGLANPALAHEVQGNLNAMSVQAAQLGTNFEAALLPVANEIIPRMTERMGKMTQLIADNKDVILDLGRDFAQVWGNIEDTVEKVGEGLSGLSKLARDNRVVRQTDSKTVVERYLKDTSVKNAQDLVEHEIANGGYTKEDIEKLRSRNDLLLKEQQRAADDMEKIYEQRRKEFAKAYEPILEKYKGDDSIKTATDLLNKLTDAEKETIAADPTEFFGSLIQRVAALNLELQELNKNAKSAKQEIKDFKSVARDLSTAGMERQNLGDDADSLADLRKARDYREAAAAIRDSMNLGDYEKKIQDNWRWLEQQLPRDVETSMEKYRAIMEQFNAQAEQIEQERADKLKDIRDSIAAADKTAFENKLADIEKEKQSWIKAGMEKSEADELAQKKREQLEQEVAEKISDIRQSINAEFQTDLEKQISAIQEEQQAWEDMGVSASEAAELAGQKMEQAFEKAVDKAKSLNQSLEDKIFAQEHSQYENDLRKLQQEVAQKAQEYQKAGLFDDNARGLLNRYYNNALRDLNAKAAEGGDYTKSPTGTNSGFQFVDYTQAQQQIIGTFTKENTARQSVINSLTAEQRQRLEETGTLEKIINAQNSLATSTEKAADNIQDASSSIEIIHGDQIGGQDFSSAEMPSLDDLLQQFGNALPTNELQDLTTQAQAVTSAQGDLGESTKNLAAENLNLADTTEKVKTALKNLAEDSGKKSSTREDTDVPSKSVTKSAPNNAEQNPPREKVHLQTTPKDTGFSIKDIGFDADLFSNLSEPLIGGLGLLSALGSIAPHPAIKALGGILSLATGAGLVSGTLDNLNGDGQSRENLSGGTSVDLSEISSPLTGIETNVQGIRDILQGKNAVDDAKAESLQDTSAENSPDLLTPLNSISDNVQSILGELQSRQEETDSDNAISELQSEISTQLSDGVSQITEGITAPIESLAQALEEIQTQNAEQGTATSETSSYLENVSSTVQSIWDEMKAAKESETTNADGNDTASQLANIDTNVAAIWQKMTEAPAEQSADNPQDSELSRLATIDEKVQSILTTMQEKTTGEESPLNTLLEPLKKIDSPLSSIANAITDKEFTFPTETIVQPLNNIANLIDKIISALSNREPPKIEVSPTMDIDLGGAYVFDDRLKTELVNDITSKIVTQITEAVERATASISRSGSYGFGG